MSDNEVVVEYLEPDGVYLVQQTEIETDQANDEDHWDNHSTQLLLDLYLKNLDKFRSSRIKNKFVWAEIATHLGKCSESCDKKFRNLKMTYVRHLKRRLKNEMIVIKWPFFESFERIFKSDGQYEPEIQQKIEEEKSENVSKTQKSMEPSLASEIKKENGTSHKKRKEIKHENKDFKQATAEIIYRQKVMEDKLDRLINVVEESNNIQRERNRLFQQYLESLN